MQPEIAFPYPAGLTPGNFYRVVSALDPAKGRLLSIDEFRTTGFNFELCYPGGEQTTLDLVNTTLVGIDEDCFGNPTSPFTVPDLNERFGSAVVVDALYRPIGVVTGEVDPASGSTQSNYSVHLDYTAISEIYRDAELITMQPQDWVLDLVDGSVLTVFGESGEPQFILPADSAEAISLNLRDQM